MKLIKKQIPLAIVFITGVFTLVSYYVPNKTSIDYIETMNKWQNIVVAFAFLLGLVSLFFSHYHKIARKADGWGYSIFVFVGFLTIVISAYVSGGRQMTDAGLTPLGWSFKYIYNALSGTMFAVLAFYIVSTAYRSFRIKSLQAFVLFVAAFILILGKVPLGQIIWDLALGWTGAGVDQVIEWIMQVPAVAGKRGIMIGISIGAIVTSLKIIFGIEKQYMGKD
ncbi:MAG: hypothetical protein A2X34_05055 [Elusimicrobia bacterium GWC2_51_8]|nr:MAG: hypothetical protein A2X33_10830 [Elusimicrobia bacterium GWA2_51_34]OGR64596.1 MAG: hypothetical protein A2X34_05055 [Elusimicrobia bacterium GWC2_51_8]OGR85829.1 MAG: hypothetical protein A2021_05680 [Elusimicrobia bacterium GWF2_52_66]HAF94689.1 hypothetical protein [Elusimicrobiota bacterium]HCE98441.1 hypothetical protein [Elusimicrobiota bacterium]